MTTAETTTVDDGLNEYDDAPAKPSLKDHRFACVLELTSGLTMCGATRWRFGDWWRLLAPMHPVDARTVVLRYLHGMSWSRIAERLGVEWKNQAAFHHDRALRYLKCRDDSETLRWMLTDQDRPACYADVTKL